MIHEKLRQGELHESELSMIYTMNYRITRAYIVTLFEKKKDNEKEWKKRNVLISREFRWDYEGSEQEKKSYNCNFIKMYKSVMLPCVYIKVCILMMLTAVR